MIPWEDLKLACPFRIVPRWGEKVRQLYPQLDQLLGAAWLWAWQLFSAKTLL